MAKFRAAAVFSSNMVLQREKNVRVFGTGKNGASAMLGIQAAFAALGLAAAVFAAPNGSDGGALIYGKISPRKHHQQHNGPMPKLLHIALPPFPRICPI